MIRLVKSESDCEISGRYSPCAGIESCYRVVPLVKACSTGCGSGGVQRAVTGALVATAPHTPVPAYQDWIRMVLEMHKLGGMLSA